MIDATLCFIGLGEPLQSILLGYKKIGFGQGKITGFGGKVEPGETIRQAAAREMLEETGVRIAQEDLEDRGSLTFIFPSHPDWDQKVYLFFARRWDGEPQESREMQPSWFGVEDIPYELMWEDGRYWLPYLLQDKKLNARFIFNRDSEHLQEVQIKPYDRL